MRLRSTTLSIMLTALGSQASGQTFAVTSTVDGNPGALRAALEAANQAAGNQPIIELRVAGTYRLDPARGRLPLIAPGKALTLRAVGYGPNARLTIDGRGVGTSTNGLQIDGAGTRIEAPLTVLATQGPGVRVTANRVHLADVEIRGGSPWGLRVENVRDFTANHLTVDKAELGVSIQGCTNARLGRAANGDAVQASGCTVSGFRVTQCADVTVEQFAVNDNQGAGAIGIFLLDSNRISLGTGGSRSSVSRNSAEGIRIEDCNDCTIRAVDILSTGTIGFRVLGGKRHTLTNALITGAGDMGVQIAGNADAITIGPTVEVAYPDGGLGACVSLANCTGVRLEQVDCHDGSPGVRAGQNTVRAVIEGSHIYRNYRGVFGVKANDLRIRGSRIENNADRGVLLDGCADAIVAGCTIINNHGPGFAVTNGSHRSIVGPANRVEGNGAAGISIRDSNESLVFDNKVVRGNLGSGITMTRSRRSTIRDNVVTANMGHGIWLFFDCNGSTVGPNNIVSGTFGAGVKIEVCDDNLVTGNQIVGNYGVGLSFIDQSTLANAGHVVRSCLIADNQNIGVVMRDGNPLTIELTTITGNWRGLHGSAGLRPHVLMQVDSSILWGNRLDDYNNATTISGVIAPQNSIVQDPPGTGSNSARDPRFRDPGAGDYRLRVDSPAIGAANPSRYAGLNLDARDCGGGDRTVECAVDLGAHELQRIEVAPRAGTSLADFTLRWPRSTSGWTSILLVSLTPPGPGPFLSSCSTLMPDAFTSQQYWLAGQNTGVLVTVPPSGVVQGTIDLGLPPTQGPWPVWAAAFAFSAQGGLQGATGVAGFDVQ